MTRPDTLEDIRAEQRRAFRTRLVEHGWLLPSRAAALPGLGPRAVAVYDGLTALIARTARREFPAEVTSVRFPPVFAVGMLEQTDYVASFPQLLGTINSFAGGQSEYRDLIAVYDEGGDWQSMLSTTGLAVASAACHALYAYLEGETVDAGRLYEMTGECFRHEPSEDPMRFVSFRMREYVRLGTEDQAKEHRRTWLEIDRGIFSALELPVDIVPANDPFFGRGGVVLAANQIEAEAKFEVVTEVYPGTETAIASANYHGTHFGDEFALSLPDGTPAQSACAAFGMERIVLALARRHGFEPEAWPDGVRSELGLVDSAVLP
ncbi:hypothetical protein [Agromyces larvae]|uniref:Aminoacyl-transfer RNA synthetases class-II family profile domain-containing protein n=1 Tax=Agromyces larvae TaxID=2929802 RepID=A0ABY4BVI7_9MICO|nr:hypothetical protein [Agromyces larvae]UOE42764.1 hypothetical protein MTO99_11235 [Agromyces larvae]